MICFLTSRGYSWTLKALQADRTAPRVTVLTYDEVLARSNLPGASYIFTDLDRLSTPQLNDAARLFRRIQENGCVAINDPARVRTRFALLRSLYRAGINDFNAYLAEEDLKPVRFPAFMRVADGHDGPLTDLIYNHVELERTIESAVVAGFARSTLLIIEYAAEPIRPGVFAKLSVYRIGAKLVNDVSWYGESWNIKGDRDGLAGDELYERELQSIKENRCPGQVARAFEIADIEYGRVDFGIVGGKPCIYEINTNPTLFGVRTDPVPQRAQSIELRWAHFISALHAIDSPSGASNALIEVSGASLQTLLAAAKISAVMKANELQLSREYERRGDLVAALERAEAAVAANPVSARALTQLSRLLKKCGRLDEAVVAIRRVIALNPRSADPIYTATLLREVGCIEDARRHLEQAVVFGAKQLRLLLLLSQICEQLGDAPAALEAARRASQVRIDNSDPKTLNALSRLNQILLKYRRVEEAIAVSKQALQLAGGGGREHRRLARMLLRAGRFVEARDVLLEALASDEEQWRTQLLLSRIYRNMDQKTASVHATWASLRLDPKAELKARQAHVQKLTRTKTKLKAELVATQKQTAGLEAQLAALHDSYSWRLTAPMRELIDFARTRKRR